MTREEYKAAIEAILFASGASVPVSRLAQTLEITEKKATDFRCRLLDERDHRCENRKRLSSRGSRGGV